MTTLTLQLTGQRLVVPTSWADVTLAQFVALFAPVPDEPRTLPEVLLGLEAGVLDQLAADDVIYLTTLLGFATDPTPVTSLLPTPDLPDPGGLPWGCLTLVQQRLASLEGRGELAALPYVLAVYRAQLRDGKPDRADEVEATLLAAPVTECYADAAAFLGRCRQRLNGTSPTRPTNQNRPTKKWTRILTRLFPRGSARPSPSTRWPAAG